MKIAVCDDNARDSAQIKAMIDEFKGQFELELDVLCFQSGEELISAMETERGFSLVILDIYMKELDGIETAKQVKKLIPDAELAFLTSSADFAVDAFGLNAVHYIIKPVTKEKLLELIERFFIRIHSPLKNFELKSKTKTYTFPLFQVQKIRSDNKGVDVYLKNSERPVRIPESFSVIEEQLDPKMFLKISRGLIVNMSYILCIDKDTCRFKDGTGALISRIEKDEIRRRYNDYLFGN